MYRWPSPYQVFIFERMYIFRSILNKRLSKQISEDPLISRIKVNIIIQYLTTEQKILTYFHSHCSIDGVRKNTYHLTFASFVCSYKTFFSKIYISLHCKAIVNLILNLTTKNFVVSRIRLSSLEITRSPNSFEVYIFYYKNLFGCPFINY